MFYLAVVVIAVTLTIGDAVAQGMGQGGMRGQRRGMGPMQRYDVKTIETVSGDVALVDTLVSPRGAWSGVHMIVLTGKDSLSVHLGPGWFLQGKLGIGAGDKVTVTGSRVTIDGKPALIAAEVKIGQEVLKLRDAQGLPLWRGRRN
jgi:hypothetical protein